MNLGQIWPISALCILCHDADRVLPFYRDVLGFEPRRAEESFYHFARRGTATSLCLWEIGHIARHTIFRAHSEAAIPNKIILSLTMASASDVEALYRKLAAENMPLMNGPAERDIGSGFHFIDPCAVIWEVRAGAAAADAGSTAALDRITILCSDIAATQSFYEDKIKFPAGSLVDGRVTYPAIDGTALSLWDVAAASDRLGVSELLGQQDRLSAKTIMLAYSFAELETVTRLYDDLRQSGVPFDEAPAHFDWDFNAAYFCDPEGNIWELFETPSNIEQRMLPQTG